MTIRVNGLLAGALLGGILIGACGSGEDRLTREEFVAQANAVCTASNQRVEQAAAAAFSTLAEGQQPSREEMQAFIDILTTEVEDQLSDLRALAPPEDMQAQIDALLAEVQRALDEIKTKEPEQVLLSGEDPFAEASRLAGAAGLDACAE